MEHPSKYSQSNCLEFVLKIAEECYKISKPLIINNDDLPWYRSFDSNLLSIENITEKRYDMSKCEFVDISLMKMILKDEAKKEMEKCNKSELKSHIFGIAPSLEKGLTLDDIINSIYDNPSEDTEDNDEMGPSMGCRTRIPTLEDLLKGMRVMTPKSALEDKVFSAELERTLKILKEYPSHRDER